MQASRNGNDLWLSFWVDTTGSRQKEYSTTFYLVINFLQTLSFSAGEVLLKWELILPVSTTDVAGNTQLILFGEFLINSGQGIFFCIWWLTSC